MKHTELYKGMSLLVMLLVVAGCTISYKFNGASINYDIIKTISIENFPNRAVYQWGPMEAMFNNALSDIYVNQTKLQQVPRGGDLMLSGEITTYDQVNKSISSDGYSSMMQLKMTVNVRFEMSRTTQRTSNATSRPAASLTLRSSSTMCRRNW